LPDFVLKNILEHFYGEFRLFVGKISNLIENDLLTKPGKEKLDIFIQRYLHINAENNGQLVSKRYYQKFLQYAPLD